MHRWLQRHLLVQVGEVGDLKLGSLATQTKAKNNRFLLRHGLDWDPCLRRSRLLCRQVLGWPVEAGEEHAIRDRSSLEVLPPVAKKELGAGVENSTEGQSEKQLLQLSAVHPQHRVEARGGRKAWDHFPQLPMQVQGFQRLQVEEAAEGQRAEDPEAFLEQLCLVALAVAVGW